MIWIITFLWFLAFMAFLGYWFGYFYDNGEYDAKEEKTARRFFGLLFTGLLYAVNVVFDVMAAFFSMLTLALHSMSAEFWWMGDLVAMLNFDLANFGFLTYVLSNLIVFTIFYVLSVYSWTAGYRLATKAPNIKVEIEAKQKAKQQLKELQRRILYERLRLKKLMAQRLGKQYDIYDELAELRLEIENLKMQVSNLEAEKEQLQELMQREKEKPKIGIRIDNRSRRYRKLGNVIVEEVE